MTTNSGKLRVIVESREAMIARLKGASADNPQVGIVGFRSYEHMYSTLTPARVAILHAMADRGLCAIADILGLVQNASASDIDALIDAGIVKWKGRKAYFPYSGLHFEFDIASAA